MTGLELYEALKPTVGEEAARMIAERLPMSEQIATKAHLDALRTATKSDIDHQTELLIARIDGRISASESRMFRWMLGFFATLWVAQSAMIVAIVTKL